jgi:hypothetical protein
LWERQRKLQLLYELQGTEGRRVSFSSIPLHIGSSCLVPCRHNEELAGQYCGSWLQSLHDRLAKPEQIQSGVIH